MNPPDPKQQQQLVEEWNMDCPPGTPVLRYRLMRPRRDPEGRKTRTSSKAWLLGGHTAVVMVESHGGAVALESLAVKLSA
jgi:hypothetical protein